MTIIIATITDMLMLVCFAGAAQWIIQAAACSALQPSHGIFYRGILALTTG